MKDGTVLIIRPIRPEDEPLMVKFHETLSERSVFHRYFQITKLSRRVAHERLVRICFADFEREFALVAELTLPESAERQILAVGRLSKLEESDKAELAVLVSDQYQRRGLGTELMRRLLVIARDQGIKSVHGYMLQENIEMRALLKKLGFRLTPTDDPAIVRGQHQL
jgi:acetyltransferase